jgi:hypothetical protein
MVVNGLETTRMVLSRKLQMINGLEPNEMVLSRELPDGQWYGSKEMVYPGISRWF